MAELQRVQVLIQKDQQRTLAEIAQRENKSVSAVIRDLIDVGLAEKKRKREEWREAMDKLREIREANAATYGVYKGDLVAEARAEREADMERVWRGES